MQGSEGEESWRRFESHEGPDEDERTEALRRMRRDAGHSSFQSGGGFEKGAPLRLSKHRGKQRFAGVRIR